MAGSGSKFMTVEKKMGKESAIEMNKTCEISSKWIKVMKLKWNPKKKASRSGKRFGGGQRPSELMKSKKNSVKSGFRDVRGRKEAPLFPVSLLMIYSFFIESLKLISFRYFHRHKGAASTSDAGKKRRQQHRWNYRSTWSVNSFV